jgi:hypothetical protein
MCMYMYCPLLRAAGAQTEMARDALRSWMDTY